MDKNNTDNYISALLNNEGVIGRGRVWTQMKREGLSFNDVVMNASARALAQETEMDYSIVPGRILGKYWSSDFKEHKLSDEAIWHILKNSDLSKGFELYTYIESLNGINRDYPEKKLNHQILQYLIEKTDFKKENKIESHLYLYVTRANKLKKTVHFSQKNLKLLINRVHEHSSFETAALDFIFSLREGINCGVIKANIFDKKMIEHIASLPHFSNYKNEEEKEKIIGHMNVIWHQRMGYNLPNFNYFLECIYDKHKIDWLDGIKNSMYESLKTMKSHQLKTLAFHERIDISNPDVYQNMRYNFNFDKNWIIERTAQNEKIMLSSDLTADSATGHHKKEKKAFKV